VAAGVVYSAQTLADLEGLDLAGSKAGRTPHTAGWRPRGRQAPCGAARRWREAQFALAADGAQALEVAAEDATVPAGSSRRSASGWGRRAARARAGAREQDALSARAQFAVRGGVVCEQAIALGRDGLVGILTTPCSARRSRPRSSSSTRLRAAHRFGSRMGRVRPRTRRRRLPLRARRLPRMGREP